MAKSSQLTITIPQEVEEFIRERVASGRFTTASDVVREGLKLLEAREQARDAALAEIRQEIQIGIEQANAGQLRDGEAFFKDLERKRSRSAE